MSSLMANAVRLARGSGATAAARGPPRFGIHPAPGGGQLQLQLQLQRRAFCATTTEPSIQTRFEDWWRGYPKDQPPRQLLQLKVPARLHAEAHPASDEVAELAAGELVEVAGNIDIVRSPPEGGWLLVRSPLEDSVDVMSDKPLDYLNGWLPLEPLMAQHTTAAVTDVIDRAELQLSDRVAARVNPETHPVLNTLKRLPWWQKKSLPAWITNSVSELYTGKVAGVVKRGRFLVQRPSGAMPERIATSRAKIIVPRERAKQTVAAGLLGFVASVLVGIAMHVWLWLHGRSTEIGSTAWPQLVGWLTLIVVFLTPLALIPCYIFANSQGATFTVIAWINLLLYSDLFSE